MINRYTTWYHGGQRDNESFTVSTSDTTVNVQKEVNGPAFGSACELGKVRSSNFIAITNTKQNKTNALCVQVMMHHVLCTFIASLNVLIVQLQYH